MKRPLRPFLVEVKRTKRSGSSSASILGLPEEPAPASAGPTSPDQELIARVFSGVGTRAPVPAARPSRPDESVSEARGPRILESLALVEDPDVADEAAGEAEPEEQDEPFGWVVHRRETGRVARRPRPAPEAAVDEMAAPGFVVKPRRGRPPRSAASAPRVLDPSAWPSDLAPAGARAEARDEAAASVAGEVTAEPVAKPVRKRGRPRTRGLDVTDRPAPAPVAVVKPVAAPVVEAASAAEAARETEGRRRTAGRRRGAGGDLPAGQRWKKRLPKVLW